MKTSTPPTSKERRLDRGQRLKHAIRMAHDPMFVEQADHPDDVVSDAENLQEQQERQRRDRGH